MDAYRIAVVARGTWDGVGGMLMNRALRRSVAADLRAARSGIP